MAFDPADIGYFHRATERIRLRGRDTDEPKAVGRPRTTLDDLHPDWRFYSNTTSTTAAFSNASLFTHERSGAPQTVAIIPADWKIVLWACN